RHLPVGSERGFQPVVLPARDPPAGTHMGLLPAVRPPGPVGCRSWPSGEPGRDGDRRQREPPDRDSATPAPNLSDVGAAVVVVVTGTDLAGGRRDGCRAWAGRRRRGPCYVGGIGSADLRGDAVGPHLGRAAVAGDEGPARVRLRGGDDRIGEPVRVRAPAGLPRAV